MYRFPKAKSIITLAIAMACSGAQAAEVSGQFTLGDTIVEPSHVVAFQKRDGNSPRQMETVVVLSLQALDHEALKNANDPYTVAINDPASMEYDSIKVFVSETGEVNTNASVGGGGRQYLDSSGNSFGPAGLSASCSHNTAKRIACTAKTIAPIASKDGARSMTLSFDTALLERPIGKPITEAAESPAGKALLAMRKAVDGKSMDAILALLIESERASYQREWSTPEENLENAKTMLDMQVPKKPLITAAEQFDANRVVLEVEGDPWGSGTKMLYLVEMKNEGGQWRFAGATPAGLLK